MPGAPGKGTLKETSNSGGGCSQGAILCIFTLGGDRSGKTEGFLHRVVPKGLLSLGGSSEGGKSRPIPWKHTVKVAGGTDTPPLSVTNATEPGTLPSGTQWLGIGWAPWKGRGVPPPPPRLQMHPCNHPITAYCCFCQARQWFRPVAPTMNVDAVPEIFEEKDVFSPYMQFAPKLKQGIEKIYPAIYHYDGSARPQVFDVPPAISLNAIRSRWGTEGACDLASACAGGWVRVSCLALGSFQFLRGCAWTAVGGAWGSVCVARGWGCRAWGLDHSRPLTGAP